MNVSGLAEHAGSRDVSRAFLGLLLGGVACGPVGGAPPEGRLGPEAGIALEAGASGDGRLAREAGPPTAPDGGSFDARAADAQASFSCEGRAGEGGDPTVSLTSGGLARESLIHVPSSYDKTRGAMLVLNFHGYPSNGSQEAELARMNDASDARGFLVAYPEGIEGGWNAGNCCISQSMARCSPSSVTAGKKS